MLYTKKTPAGGFQLQLWCLNCRYVLAT